MATLTYHGHATFSIETDGGKHLVIDPFFGDNPSCDTSVDDVDADFILLTHGHYDHVADAVGLAKRTGATVIASHEISKYMEGQGLTTSPQHIGGGVQYPFGYVKMTPALHGGQVAGDDEGAFTTVPGGFWMDLAGKHLYHAGDTALLMDMQLLKGKVDLALLPIGDNFTMGPDDAVRAVEFIRPGTVIPIHYNTFDMIAQDAEAFRAQVGDLATVEIVQPGGVFEF